MNKRMILTAALAGPVVAGASDKTPVEKPNILFILVDDLGLGDLSCQYAQDLSTPNIDRIFETGVRMDNFYANSNVSSPTRAAIMTGRFPSMVGVPGVIRTQQSQNWGYLLPSAITMPQMLKKAGYNTALVGKWHLGLEHPNLPNEKGFDYFHGFLGDMMDDYYTHKREGHDYMYLNEKPINPKGHATDIFTEWGVRYIEKQARKDEPFFLYLAYNAPHSPLQPPVEWLEKVQKRNPSLPEKRARLVALVEHLDYNVGKVMEALEKSGQRENTLVVFVSDNGGDRGSMANNGPTRGAKGDFFEGGIRVACAINLPGVYEGGVRNGNFMMTMDFMPTFCDMLNIPIEHEIDGISVLPALDGKEQDTDDRYVFWVRTEGGNNFCGKSQCAVKHGRYKLVQNNPFEAAETFDLEADPMEQKPVGQDSKVVKDLKRALTGHYNRHRAIPSQKAD